jgi:transcriptional regulator of acetoin/glycerol metabolism
VSPNSWLAVDAGTTPKVRAQELRFAWERFLADDEEEDPGIVREAIADSWRRCQVAGVDPTGSRKAPIVADEGETHERFAEHPLARASTLIRECLSAIADEAGYLIVVSDANGMLMMIEGSAQVRLRAAGDMNFAEGTLWSEGGAGTNAIGTALAVDHAVMVFGPEHFHEPVQRWVCSAAPPRTSHEAGRPQPRDLCPSGVQSMVRPVLGRAGGHGGAGHRVGPPV